jgi:hypothetical protein
MAVLNTADTINEYIGSDSYINTGKQGINTAKTEESVKELLKSGTPDWFSHPEHYKDLAKEAYVEQKEISDSLVSEYKLPNQERYTDAKARMRNELSTKQLLAKLRDNGLKCTVQQSANSLPGTAGLFAVRSGYDQLGLQLVTTVQVPGMYEWSVLRTDEHGLPNGEKYIGWRNVCAALVQKGFWPEEKVNKVFGKPPHREFAMSYHRNMWNVRNQIMRPA